MAIIYDLSTLDVLSSGRRWIRSLETVPDSYEGSGIPTWLNWDMAPPLPQGDAFGLAMFGAGFDICVDLLGVQQQTGWAGRWRFDARDAGSYRELGREVAAQLGLLRG